LRVWGLVCWCAVLGCCALRCWLGSACIAHVAEEAEGCSRVLRSSAGQMAGDTRKKLLAPRASVCLEHEERQRTR